MKKRCGNCYRFFKWKNDKDGGGLCECLDARTKPDWGRDCEDWKGIKYKRKKEKNYASIYSKGSSLDGCWNFS